MTEKSILPLLPALSCVERYCLAWIKQYCDEIKCYGHSFIALKQCLDDFSNGAKYETYETIPRIQEVLEEAGMIEHRYISDKKIFEAIKRAEPNDLCLMKVNDQFFELYKRRAWRADHYINIDGDFHYINEYPLSNGTLTEEEVSRYYGGAIIIFRMRNPEASITEKNTEKILEQEFTDISLPREMKAIEDATGVLRISRKRMRLFYGNAEGLSGLFDEELSILDKLYLSARMYQIKRKESDGFISDNFNRVIEIEKLVRSHIYDKRRGKK